MAENRQIQLRRDSVADWYSNNPTLASGEPGVETDTHRLRIGDGATATTSLAVHQPIRTYAASANVTLADSDDYTHIFVTTGATDRTVTLPTAADNANRQYVIKKVDSGAGTVTIDGEGAETIDGEATKLLATQYSWMTLVCDGSEWHVVDYYHAPYDTGWTSVPASGGSATVTHNFATEMELLSMELWGHDTNVGVYGRVENTTSGDGTTIRENDSNSIYVQNGSNPGKVFDSSGTERAIENYRVIIRKIDP